MKEMKCNFILLLRFKRISSIYTNNLDLNRRNRYQHFIIIKCVDRSF